MDPLSLLTDALSALAGGLTHATRLIRLHTPLGDDSVFA